MYFLSPENNCKITLMQDSIYIKTVICHRQERRQIRKEMPASNRYVGRQIIQRGGMIGRQKIYRKKHRSIENLLVLACPMQGTNNENQLGNYFLSCLALILFWSDGLLLRYFVLGFITSWAFHCTTVDIVYNVTRVGTHLYCSPETVKCPESLEQCRVFSG